jgi:signal transduction histidine kinase
MTSLPIVIPNPAGAVAVSGDAASDPMSGENRQFLLHAFRSFAEASDSLERSYGMLRSEVERLHGELAKSNAGLARSVEENLRMRRHLDRILEGLPCGVLVARSDGTVSLVNPAGRRLLYSILPRADSHPRAAAAFESLSMLPSELRTLLDRARSTPGEQEHCFKDESENDRSQKDGRENGREKECCLAVKHAAVKTENAEADALASPAGGGDPESIFILRDVSDAKRLVREREKLRREQALAEMSAILAHEIRNPLGSLELFAGLLAEAELPAECRPWVEHVQAGLRTLAATVNNVLHFHSLPPPERVPTDLGRLLDWAGGFLVPMARRARVELRLRNRLQGVCFPADRHRLEQVLLNLVLNALRAMPGGGWVELAGHKTRDGGGSAVAICVSDTGPGIPPEQAAKIFEPGFSTRPGSPGLGLAVCRKIVEQHGGWLATANRAGAGACFTLTFPWREESWPEESLPGNRERDKFRKQVAG